MRKLKLLRRSAASACCVLRVACCVILTFIFRTPYSYFRILKWILLWIKVGVAQVGLDGFEFLLFGLFFLLRDLFFLLAVVERAGLLGLEEGADDHGDHDGTGQGRVEAR